MTSTHVQPELGQEDMSREFCLSFANIVKYMQVRDTVPLPAPRRLCSVSSESEQRAVPSGISKSPNPSSWFSH